MAVRDACIPFEERPNALVFSNPTPVEGATSTFQIAFSVDRFQYVKPTLILFRKGVLSSTLKMRSVPISVSVETSTSKAGLFEIVLNLSALVDPIAAGGTVT